jgi:hypothetical protein
VHTVTHGTRAEGDREGGGGRAGGRGRGDLAQSKVSEADVSIRVREDVFRLEIPVYKTVFVQTLERHEHLGRIEARALLRKTSRYRQVIEDVSSCPGVAEAAAGVAERCWDPCQLWHLRVWA